MQRTFRGHLCCWTDRPCDGLTQCERGFLVRRQRIVQVLHDGGEGTSVHQVALCPRRCRMKHASLIEENMFVSVKKGQAFTTACQNCLFSYISHSANTRLRLFDIAALNQRADSSALPLSKSSCPCCIYPLRNISDPSPSHKSPLLPPPCEDMYLR